MSLLAKQADEQFPVRHVGISDTVAYPRPHHVIVTLLNREQQTCRLTRQSGERTEHEPHILLVEFRELTAYLLGYTIVAFVEPSLYLIKYVAVAQRTEFAVKLSSISCRRSASVTLKYSRLMALSSTYRSRVSR